MSQGFGRYAVAVVIVVAVVAGLLSLGFHDPNDAMAIWISAAVTVAVQLVAFWLGRKVGSNLMARMGIGALLRFFALIAYTVLAVAVLHLPLTAALISLALLLFVSTFIEPVLIKS